MWCAQAHTKQPRSNQLDGVVRGSYARLISGREFLAALRDNAFSDLAVDAVELGGQPRQLVDFLAGNGSIFDQTDRSDLKLAGAKRAAGHFESILVNITSMTVQ